MKDKNNQDSAQAPTAVIEAPADVQDQAPQSTSERLFPDFKPEPILEGADAPDTADEAATDPGKEVPPAVETPAPAQEPEAPAPSDVLDISAFQGKKVRVKVDGEEMEVPAELLLKNYQLDAHLTRKGQQLGEQRRALEEMRKDLLEKARADTTALETAVEEGDSPPEIKKLQVELDLTRKQLAEISAATSDIVFQKSVSRLDEHVRSTLGFDDFKAYVPKIQEFIRGQLSNPVNPTPQEIAYFDTPTFYLQKFQEMKLKELSKPAPAPAAPPPAAPAATPPAPRLTKIVNVETASGAVPETISEATEQKIQTAFSRAKKTGSTQDWADYYALRRSA